MPAVVGGDFLVVAGVVMVSADTMSFNIAGLLPASSGTARTLAYAAWLSWMARSRSSWSLWSADTDWGQREISDGLVAH